MKTITDIENFWNWIDDRMAEVNINSLAELERKANASNGSIRIRKRDLKLPTVEMAEGLCKALRVSWLEIWIQAGFIKNIDIETLPQDSGKKELSEFVEIAKQLPPEKLKEAKSYLLWLLNQN